MNNTDRDDEWAQRLTSDQLDDELFKRGLSAEGTHSIRISRLLRYVRRERLGVRWTAHQSTPPIVDTMSDEGCLELPQGEEVRPDSPMAPEAERHSRETPRTPSSGRGPPNGTSSNSAATAYNVMRKWNLKFSGTRGEDAETFLLRIEEGRELIPVSDEDILCCLPFFLSGIALHWFRGKKNRLPTWAVFKNAWRTRFGDPDFQFALRDEIMRRTQGEYEPVADYLTCLTALFDRLSPPWEEPEKVSSAFRNMLPRLQVAVRRDEVDDLETLKYLATRAETSHAATQRYCAPPAPDKSLFPDLAYRSPRNSSRPNKSETLAALSASTAKPTPSTSGTKSGRPGKKFSGASSAASESASTSTKGASRPAKGTSATCWNCDEVGHLSRDCEVTLRKHCYRCGRAEVTLRTCPDCSGKE